MASNTKFASLGLNKSDAKENLRSYMYNYPLSSFHFNSVTGVTVLVSQDFAGSNVMRVSTAIMSPDEYKFRPNVGKYLAVTNMENGQFINVPSDRIMGVLAALLVY